MSTVPSVLLFIPSLDGGGAERIFVTLANGFAGQGLRVHLVAGVGGPFAGDVQESVRLTVLDRSRAATCVPALVRILRREQPNALLTGMPHGNLAAYLAHRFSRSGANLALGVHNHYPRHHDGVHQAIVNRAVRHAYRAADVVICVSHGVEKSVREATNVSNSTTIYNPIMPPIGTDEGMRIGRDPRLIVAAGRLAPQKDYPTMLRAFAQLRRQDEARLVILGGGPLLKDLRSLSKDLGIGDAVEFKGFVSNPGRWMAQAQAFALSSQKEGLPTVLVEAMYAGAAIVSTDCPSGPREILEDGRWGELVPVGDAEAMAVALGAALRNGAPSDVADQLKLFDPNRIVKQYMHALGVLEGAE